MNKTTVKIVQKPNVEEVPAEVIAQAITDIAAASRKLANTRLGRNAIVALIHDYSKVSKKTINLVLNNLEQLERIWLKGPK